MPTEYTYILTGGHCTTHIKWGKQRSAEQKYCTARGCEARKKTAAGSVR